MNFKEGKTYKYISCVLSLCPCEASCQRQPGCFVGGVRGGDRSTPTNLHRTFNINRKRITIDHPSLSSMSRISTSTENESSSNLHFNINRKRWSKDKRGRARGEDPAEISNSCEGFSAPSSRDSQPSLQATHLVGSGPSARLRGENGDVVLACSGSSHMAFLERFCTNQLQPCAK